MRSKSPSMLFCHNQRWPTAEDKIYLAWQMTIDSHNALDCNERFERAHITVIVAKLQHVPVAVYVILITTCPHAKLPSSTAPHRYRSQSIPCDQLHHTATVPLKLTAAVCVGKLLRRDSAQNRGGALGRAGRAYSPPGFSNVAITAVT